MPSPGDIFRSYGSIRVLLVEADEGSRRVGSDVTDSKFFVSVSLVDDKESMTLGKFSSACYLFSSSRNPTRIDEEYLFDGVSSAHSLMISLSIVGDRSENSCQRTTIPVSRLEEDMEIFQWYQMYSTSTSSNRGEMETPIPGSAIKLQIVYMKVELPYVAAPASPEGEDRAEPVETLLELGVADKSQLSLLMPVPSPPQSPNPQNQSDAVSARDSGKSLKETASAGEKVLVSILKSPSRKMSLGVNVTSRKEEIRATFSEDLTKTVYEELDEEEGVSSVKNDGSVPKTFSFNYGEQDLLNEKEGEERLTVGLIDYALLIGPVGDGLESEEGYMESCRPERRIHVQYSLHPCSDVEGNLTPMSGYGSTSGGGQEQYMVPGPGQSPSKASSGGNSNSAPMESDMCIWDRFPVEDHDESPLPAKIEYFACPDGSKVIRATTRPEPRFSTFILSGAGESDGQYGICLTAFVKCHGRLEDLSHCSPQSKGPNTSRGGRLSCSSVAEEEPPSEASAVGEEWWSRADDSDSDCGALLCADGGEPLVDWTAVTICLLSRWPHVQQLQRCLLYIYRSCVLTSLQRWEGHCEGLISEHRDRLMLRSCSSDACDKSGDRGGSFLVLDPLRLSSPCVELLTMLCLESPVPLWGVFTLDLVLPSKPVCTDSAATLRRLGLDAARGTEWDPDTVVKFAQCPPEDLPLCPYSLSASLFRCLGARGVLTVLSAALAESRILFFSSDASLLPAVCESLRILLYPLKWAHVYLPVVPAPLLDLVQAPVPFILGTLTKWMGLIPPECLCDVVLVDLDTGAIDSVRAGAGGVMQMVQPFPARIERWLLCSLSEVLMPNPDVSDVAVPFGSEQDPSRLLRVQEKDTMLQLLVFHVMANLLRYVPGCIFSLNVGQQEGPSHHVFNRPLFLSECIDDESRPFLTLLTDTNAFEQFTESLYSPSMGFYLRALGALPAASTVKKVSGVSPMPSGSGMKRRGSRQIDRDVLPLSADEAAPPEGDEDGPAFYFPDSVITGGDRLNVVKLPTVSVTVDAVTVIATPSPFASPMASRRNSSSSIRGMLVFPASSQQVNNPFSLARTGSADSFISKSSDSPLPLPPKALGSLYDCSRGVSLFPDWVSALTAVQGDDAYSYAPDRGGSGKELSLSVAKFYSPLLMCERESQDQDEWAHTHTDMGTTGVSYEGYQSGNVISPHSLLPDSTPHPVLSLVLTSPSRDLGSMSSDTAPTPSYQDSQEWEGKLSMKSPRLKARRSSSLLERQLTAEDVRGNEKRSASSSEKERERPPLLSQMSKSKRMRSCSNLIPTSRTNTGDSGKAISPSYLSFLPLIGKTSGLTVVTETGTGRISLTAEAESDSSSAPNSPNRSQCPGAPIEDFMMPPNPKEHGGVIVRSRSYGRIRSSTFSLVSTGRRGSFSKPIRRRHSAEGAAVSPVSVSPSYPKTRFRPPYSRYRSEPHMPSSAMDALNGGERRTSSLLSHRTSLSSCSSLEPLIDPGMGIDMDSGKHPSTLCLCPPLIFDTAAFELAAGRIDEWTVGELAVALKQPLQSILKTLKGEAEAGLDPFSPWPSCNNSPVPPSVTSESTRSPIHTRSPNRRWPNRAAASYGGAVTDYLQYAFSGVSMSARQVEHLERRCISALDLHDNRMRLVYLLRQTNKGTPIHSTPTPSSSHAIARRGLQLLSHPHSNPKDLESQLFPLHSSTFDLLSKLYSLAVEACVTHRDYLAAYGLLGVGGLYFQVQSRPQKSHSVHDIDGSEETEFLSERICQHPIFQSPHLWMCVMRDKLSSKKSTSPPVSPTPTATAEFEDTARERSAQATRDSRERVVRDLDALFLEAYALLFIINRLGVNFERAAAFNKMVASEFCLAKGQYLQLQQYTDKLYNRVPSSQGPETSEVYFLRTRSKSDSAAQPDFLKSKERNSFPLSAREEMSVFKADDVLEWGADKNDQGSVGRMEMYRNRGLDNDGGVVLADLTHLMPPVPPTSPDSGAEYTSPPLSWSSSVLPSFSPLSFKGRGNTAPFSRSQGKAGQSSGGAAASLKGYGYSPRSDDPTSHTGKKPPRGAEPHTPEILSPTRKRASMIATRLRSYFTRNGSGSRVEMRKSSGQSDTPTAADPSSPLPQPKLPPPSAPAPVGTAVRSKSKEGWEPSQSRNPDRKSVQCSELNTNNYHSVPLEGSLLDRPVCLDTKGRYLLAGLKDGGINVNNLKTGMLMMRLTHSTYKSRAGSFSSAKQPVHPSLQAPYGGVTHVHRLSHPSREVEGPGCTFASGCCAGVVRVWRLTATAMHSGGEVEGDGDLNDALVVADQAVSQTHQGEAITCLAAEYDSSSRRGRRAAIAGGWMVVSGDGRGCVWVSTGEFSLPRSSQDSEEDGSALGMRHLTGVKQAERRGGGLHGLGLGSVQHMDMHSVSATCMRGEGAVTCLTLIKRRWRGSGGEGRGGGIAQGGPCSQWQHVAVGTFSGRIALVDVRSGHCVYLLKGHSGCVTAIVTPPSLSVDLYARSGTLIASCGSDRRVLLWNTACVPKSRVGDSSHGAQEGTSEGQGDEAGYVSSSSSGASDSAEEPLVLQGRMLGPHGLCAPHTHTHRSSTGPLTALCVSPGSSSYVRGGAAESEGLRVGDRDSFTLAAASAGGSVLLWDLSMWHADAVCIPHSNRGAGAEAGGAGGLPLEAVLQAGPAFELRGHTDRVTHIQCRGGNIETASLDGSMRVWTRARSRPQSACPTAPHSVSNSNGSSPKGAGGRHDIAVSRRPSYSSVPPYRARVEAPYTCSAVLKVFGSDTDDNTGIAFFSVTRRVARNRSAERDADGVLPFRPLSLSPTRMLFCDSKSESEEGGESPTPSVQRARNFNDGEDETPCSSAASTTGSLVPSSSFSSSSSSSCGTSWLVAVSLGGAIKAFTTPSFVPPSTRIDLPDP